MAAHSFLRGAVDSPLREAEHSTLTAAVHSLVRKMCGVTFEGLHAAPFRGPAHSPLEELYVVPAPLKGVVCIPHCSLRRAALSSLIAAACSTLTEAHKTCAAPNEPLKGLHPVPLEELHVAPLEET